MTPKDWVAIISAIAWPTVGILALIYVWKSDAISKLIRISDSIKDLKSKIADLVEAEERLAKTSSTLRELTDAVNQVQNDFLSMKADVENIRDKIEQRPDVTADSEHQNAPPALALSDMFNLIDKSWQDLLNEIENKFGYIDKRSVAGEVYRFSHGNRKGPKLTHDQADEISRLHSSIKSFRRRRNYLEEWLDQETLDDFVSSCIDIQKQIVKI